MALSQNMRFSNKRCVFMCVRVSVSSSAYLVLIWRVFDGLNKCVSASVCVCVLIRGARTLWCRDIRVCVRAAARVSSVLGKLSSPFKSAHSGTFWWLCERTGGQMVPAHSCRFTANSTRSQRARERWGGVRRSNLPINRINRDSENRHFYYNYWNTFLKVMLSDAPSITKWNKTLNIH